MIHALEHYSDLKKTQITWVGGNGLRSIADLCYRTRELRDGVSEVVCVVTERADNPGMSITNSAESVVDAICSRFPVRDKLLITERYDQRSYSQPRIDGNRPSYMQLARPEPAGFVKFNPVPSQIAEFFDAFWNDRAE